MKSNLTACLFVITEITSISIGYLTILTPGAESQFNVSNRSNLFSECYCWRTVAPALISTVIIQFKSNCAACLLAITAFMLIAIGCLTTLTAGAESQFNVRNRSNFPPRAHSWCNRN